MIDLNALTTVEAIVPKLVELNDAYRNEETPLVSDEVYDALTAKLAQLDPNHPLLTQVEPEGDFGEGKVRHIRPMLSTDKAYTREELEAWVKRIQKACDALAIDINDIKIQATAKLDGMAGRFGNNVLASRGNGLTGNNITSMINKGLVMQGEGDGEIVLLLEYFEQNLKDVYEHPRNVVTGIVGADTLRQEAIETLQDGAIRFVNYTNLPMVEIAPNKLADEIESVREYLLSDEQCPYPNDGIVLAVDNINVRDEMGSTSHHHNWQLAHKVVGELADTRVLGITWQVGRTGRLTPVLNVEPVRLANATVSNATAHHAGNVKRLGLGAGAIACLTRSGEVIPKVVSIRSAVEPDLPTECPCCNTTLEWSNDFLVCQNVECEDRVKASLEHFFKTLGTIDLFGPKTCSVLVENGYTDLNQIMDLNTQDYQDMGFGQGQASNLVSEIRRGFETPVEDFRLLAAFGIEHLGKGDSKKLLKELPLEYLDQIDHPTLLGIRGFGEITTESIMRQLPEKLEMIRKVTERFTAIETTPPNFAKTITQSAITGKNIVFTGTMVKGKRDDMKRHAESLGAIIQSGVNGKTNYLVAGEKVGASKLTKAQTLGVTILSEDEYLKMIG